MSITGSIRTNTPSYEKAIGGDFVTTRKPRKAPKDDITVRGFMILEDGSIVPVEDLTQEQIERFQERSAKRLSRTMSEYYSQHPEEYAKLRPLE